jgi:hypothetical protein
MNHRILGYFSPKCPTHCCGCYRALSRSDVLLGSLHYCGRQLPLYEPFSLSLTYSRRQVRSPHRMIILGAVSLFLYGASAFDSIRDDDLSTFVTVSAGPRAGLVIRCSRIGQLPNHRAIKWNITYHDRSSVAPGYWFVAPYFAAESEPATTRWIPSQIGPHIFDQDGVCKVIHSRLSDFY